jgi:hypothetical protein
MSTTTATIEYVQAVKINNWMTGEERVHAADPAKLVQGPYDMTTYSVTTRCGIKHTSPVCARVPGYWDGTWAKWADANWHFTCERCDQLIAAENDKAFEADDHSDQGAIALLEEFVTTLPRGHQDRAGTLRAIEVLKTYGHP